MRILRAAILGLVLIFSVIIVEHDSPRAQGQPRLSNQAWHPTNLSYYCRVFRSFYFGHCQRVVFPSWSSSHSEELQHPTGSPT